jgi:hypothetical protein
MELGSYCSIVGNPEQNTGVQELDPVRLMTMTMTSRDYFRDVLLRKAAAALFLAIAFRLGHSGAQEPPRDAHGRVGAKVSEFRVLRDYHAPLLLHSLKRRQPTSPSCPCMVDRRTSEDGELP